MKNRRTTAFRQKVYLLTGAVTIAALVAMIGVYQNIDEGDLTQNEQAQAEETQVADGAVDYGPGSGVEYESYDYDEWASVAEGESDVDETEAAMAQRDALDRNDAGQGTDTAAGTEIQGAVEDGETEEAASVKDQLSFGKDSTISWPLKGNVLMNYSMDKTTYFATLDQYKYNPAIVVSAKVNDKVLAGVKGVIADIETNENTGLTVTVDLGGGYQAIYGQLKEVKKGVGDTVNPEDVIGYIAEPTKYYSVEGSNLYFAMTKDQTPVNPMSFLK